jgi:hypothetical protein
MAPLHTMSHSARAGLLAFGVLAALPALAVVQDEIQVFDATVTERGKWGLELHLNTTPSSRVQAAYPGEVRTLHGVRFMPEIAYGLGHNAELGLHLPTVLEPGGRYSLAGARLRMKWVGWAPAKGSAGSFGGLNIEFSRIRQRFEEHRNGTELKLFGGWEGGSWLAAVNFNIASPLSGPERSERPRAAWSAKLSRELRHGLALGTELYAGTGPLGRPDPRHEQDQRLYLTVDTDVAGWEVNAGIGRGLTDGADKWTLKFIVGVPF